MVRAKFKCISAKEYESGSKNYEFAAVYASGNENHTWAKATPSGNLQITIDNPEAQKFEPGKEYYLDFSSASA